MTTSKVLSVRVPADVVLELKVRCVRDGVSLQAAIEDAVRGYLMRPTPAGTPERPPVRRRTTGTPIAERIAAIERERAAIEAAHPPAGVQTAEGVRPPRLCLRCGHDEAAHWIKGCLAGCVCSAQRYRTTED